jgi:hypothetical protein
MVARTLGVPESLVETASWRTMQGMVIPPRVTALGMGERGRALGLQPEVFADALKGISTVVRQ